MDTNYDQANEAKIAEEDRLNEAKIAEEDRLNEAKIAEEDRLNFFDQVYPNLVIVKAKNINLDKNVLSITNKNGEVVSLTIENDALNKIDNFIKNNPSLQGNSGGKRKRYKTKYSKKCKK